MTIGHLLALTAFCIILFIFTACVVILIRYPAEPDDGGAEDSRCPHHKG